MSTFNGLVAEFPDIRIDFFRANPIARPPLACFLSHVHSDHLAGLESLRSPFVYCSAATREILLRLERYPCRINYAKGILEARQQTFKHLHKVLKPLPLGTPTCVELRPGSHIQVTLLDANHCPGAVMFLIEGDGKAILYTGDIRSEPWFVNAISRSPSLVEYSAGLKALDKIYLDTSFINDVPFQTKAEGIAELLRKVSRYPDDTVFHFQAWTYGYEDVWIALSKALKSPIHVDEYKMKIYHSLQVRPSDGRFASSIHLSPEAPALVGYMCGNSPHPGCLTSDPNVRLHSCEKGDMCAAAQAASVVHIQPIVAHLPGGADLAEVGVGGGGDDLEREAEIELMSREDLQPLLASISACKTLTTEAQGEVVKFLNQLISRGRNLSLDLDPTSLDGGDDAGGLEKVIRAIAQKSVGGTLTSALSRRPDPATGALPRNINFPYSRHSSYPELCHIVEAFKPRDVWPCTVDEEEWLKNGISIGSLFGRYCSGSEFAHDLKMGELVRTDGDESQQGQGSTQRTESQAPLDSSPVMMPQEAPLTPSQKDSEPLSAGSATTPRRQVSPLGPTQEAHSANAPNTDVEMTAAPPQVAENSAQMDPAELPNSGCKRRYDEFAAQDADADAEDDNDPGESQQTEKSFVSTLSMRHSLTRREAYYEMLDNARGDWVGFGLLSTDGSHTVPEKEL